LIAVVAAENDAVVASGILSFMVDAIVTAQPKSCENAFEYFWARPIEFGPGGYSNPLGRGLRRPSTMQVLWLRRRIRLIVFHAPARSFVFWRNILINNRTKRAPRLWSTVSLSKVCRENNSNLICSIVSSRYNLNRKSVAEFL
jgi:hypothetical protein